MADQYIPVPGGTNNNNYANVELILDIAKRTHVQVSLHVIDRYALKILKPTHIVPDRNCRIIFTAPSIGMLLFGLIFQNIPLLYPHSPIYT